MNNYHNRYYISHNSTKTITIKNNKYYTGNRCNGLIFYSQVWDEIDVRLKNNSVVTMGNWVKLQTI